MAELDVTALTNAQLDAHRELLRELESMKRDLQAQARKANAANQRVMGGLNALYDQTEELKQGLGWLPSIAIAIGLVYPVANAIHENANYEVAFTSGAKFQPLVYVAGKLKDLENWTANKAINWGIEYAGGSTSYSAPLKGKLRVTSGFGMRIHPVTGMRKMHNGVDYAAPIGTPVLATLSGVVAKVDEDDAAGKWVSILHANGEVSKYLHLSEWKVEEGDSVSTGQEIALSGNTGRGTGAHLHFALQRANGEYYDPASVVGIVASANQWDYFRDTVAASESNGHGDYQAINPYGFRGRYQMGTPALCDAGYIKQQVCDTHPTGNRHLDHAGNWTIAGGSDTFLKSEGHQNEAYRRWQKRNLAAARQAGVISDTTPAHRVAGFLHAAQFGVGNAIKWYKSGIDSKDGNGVSTSEYASRGEDAFKAKYGRGASATPLLSAIEGTNGVTIASASVGAKF